jgi:DNA-binding LacI/PurR family transcriptional regulator
MASDKLDTSDSVRKNIGIKDVAERAGVSPATVSNVLNKKKPVSPKLESRVWEAVNELGYHANPFGRGLKSSRTNQIGVIVPSFSQIFFPRVLQGIHEAARNEGYTASVFETHGNIEIEKKHIDYIQNSWFDGIILSSFADSENRKDRKYIETLDHLGTMKKNIPLVSLENVMGQNADAVIVDNQAAAEKAVNHLIEIGHRRIAHVAAPTKLKNGRLRLVGYKNALEKEGIDVDPSLIRYGDYSAISGYHATKTLLDEQISFTAVFAASDQMAIGSMRALLDAQLRIPEDVAIIGIDNNFPSSLVTPTLSTINIPKFEMGYQAFKLLVQRIENPTKTRLILTLDHDLIIRRSTSIHGEQKWILEGW